MKRTLLVALAVIAFSAVSASAGPVILAGVPGGGAWHYPGGGGSVGYEFTSNADLSVINLGIFDYQSNGLAFSHDVGLWDSDGNLIASVTIPSGTGATLNNGYRWMTVTASLTAGSNYILGAGYYDGGADWFYDTATIDPLFTLVQDLFVDNGSGLVKPTTVYFDDGVHAWFGPNLEAAVPDGGTTLALLGGALLGLGALRRKFRG